jgi:hypothetical protein
MKKRVSPGARRAINLIQARAAPAGWKLLGRCDLVELYNLFFHSSAGVTQGDRRRFDPDSGAGYSLRRKGRFSAQIRNQKAFPRFFGTP